MCCPAFFVFLKSITGFLQSIVGTFLCYAYRATVKCKDLVWEKEEKRLPKVELLGYKISRLDLVNELAESGEIRLSDKMEFSVEFEPEDSMAVAALAQYLELENSNEFYMELVLEGIFHVEGMNGKKLQEEAHLRCYDILFPYADQFIRILSMNSGMQEVAVKKKELLPENVHAGENPKTVWDKKVINFQPDTDS